MNTHVPVLMHEALQGLSLVPHGTYVDATFGRGGHSASILEALGPEGRLIALDKDWDAVAHGKTRFADDARFEMVQGSFAELKTITQDLGVYGQVNGLLMDLGVSSPQLDDADRGFGFMQDGPLDMRMNKNQGLSAENFIANADEALLSKVFFEYGEERFARRMARAIVMARELEPIVTTKTLAEVVAKANPKWERHKHPATRVFQAIRIYVNQELSDLEKCLQDSLNVLGVGGRLVVISFHSLEDRIVKQFMRHQEQGVQHPKGLPIRASDIHPSFKRIGRAIKPKETEVKDNPRSRSAILRIGEKIS